MASLVYDSLVDGLAAGTFAFGVDAFRVMLVSGYVPDKANDTDRADVTGEVTGAGYTAGGASVVTNVSNAAADKTDIDLGGATWADSTISATGAVYYSAGSDQLVAFVDFGGVVSSLNGAFSLSASTITIANP
jgi:hypothetical protein